MLSCSRKGKLNHAYSDSYIFIDPSFRLPNFFLDCTLLWKCRNLNQLLPTKTSMTRDAFSLPHSLNHFTSNKHNTKRTIQSYSPHFAYYEADSVYSAAVVAAAAACL